MAEKYEHLVPDATIGAVYNPFIKYAEDNDPKGHDYLKAVGKYIFENNPDKCPNVSDGIEAAKSNLDYYCQYYSPETASKTKKFFALGPGFRTLMGDKLP